MFKKLLSLILLGAMLMSILSMAVFASEDPASITPADSETIADPDLSVLTSADAPSLEISTVEPEQQDTIDLTEEEKSLESTAPDAIPVISFSETNPLYPGDDTTLIEQEAAILNSSVDGINENIVYATSLEEAAAVVREAMKARETNFTLYWMRDEMITASSQIREVFTVALAHTGVPTEGDYLRWSYIKFDTNAYGEIANGMYYYTLPCVVSYYTTADQEAEVTQEIGTVMSSVGLPKQSDYETLLAIYDFICDTVTYDYEHLNDSTYTLKYSAYAALINKTAVCQGYAALYYRLALESGIDCRLIAGRGNNANHGWVIAKVGSMYYNLDPTWDAGNAEYSYFLCGTTDFGDHAAFDEYTTSSYISSYPISDTMYAPSLMGDVDSNGDIDMQDVVRLVRYIAGWSVTVDSFTSNANEDTEIDLRDCIVLLRYLAGWTDMVYRVGVSI